MKRYESPVIEIDEIDVQDVITTSGTTGGNMGGGSNEFPTVPGRPPMATDGGMISTTGGRVTINGYSEGGFSAGDLFGNR